MINDKVSMHIMISEKMKEQLQKEADKRDLTLSAYVRILLKERKKK